MPMNKTGTYKDYLVWEFTQPPSFPQLWFEKIDLADRIQWALKYWTISIWSVVIYMALIFLGQKWMQNRKPFQLRTPLILWNLGLAIFSTWSFIRVFPELFLILSQENGFFRSVCVREFFDESSGFYAYLFMWSKIVELGDTSFIILRKRPLLFLHWFHHITVLMAVWYMAFFFDPVSRWFGTVNLGVHSVMYTYYTLRAMKIHVPKKVAMCITSLQIGQMIYAVFLNIYAIYIRSVGVQCAISDEGIQIHFFLYFMYLILFAHYFYKAYMNPKIKSD